MNAQKNVIVVLILWGIKNSYKNHKAFLAIAVSAMKTYYCTTLAVLELYTEKQKTLIQRKKEPIFWMLRKFTNAPTHTSKVTTAYLTTPSLRLLKWLKFAYEYSKNLSWIGLAILPMKIGYLEYGYAV